MESKSVSHKLGDKKVDERISRPRAKRVVLLSLLALISLLSLAVYFGPIGRAMRQASDMANLHGPSFEITQYAQPNSRDEFWLKFLPREGVLAPIEGMRSNLEGIAVRKLEVATAYDSWEYITLDVQHGVKVELRRALERWTNLRELRLSGQFGSEAIPSFANHRFLSEISLDSPHCDSKVVAAVLQAPSLKFLTVRSGLTNDGVAGIIVKPNLRTLSLKNNSAITSQPFISAVSRSLRHLDVSGTSIDDTVIRAVVKWPRLQSLSAANTRITNAAFENIPEDSRRLTHLELAGTALTDHALVGIAQFAELKSLDLQDTDVGGDHLEVLNSLSSLETLFLPSIGMSDEGLRNLELPELRLLFLGGFEISPAAFDKLTERFPLIEVVELAECACSSSEIAALRGAYPQVNFIFH